jgi:ACS family glucarate transporter-like MFS transporter
MAEITLARPTYIRYGVLVLATLVALLLYLDRFCLSTSDVKIQEDMKFSPEQMAWIRSAFFFTYALAQIPMGRLSDRFGVRATLGCYMVVWSAFTGLIGAIQGVADFVIYRLGCGLFEAGAYPACAAMIRKWFPESMRGTASGVVSLGGRFGGTITPLVIPFLMVEFGGWRNVMGGLGVFGVAYGLWFLFVFRNRPREHAWCNPAEVALIEGEHATPMDPPPLHIPWRRLLTHTSLWLSSFIQVGVNFGWVFILTGDLNSFLKNHLGVSEEARPWMVFTIMVFNLPALILGGRLTDSMTSRYGKRWGRALPMAVPRFISAMFFLAVGLLLAFIEGVDPWFIVLLLGGMAFFSDLALPAIWGFNLDVGKRHVGVVLGWGNMWGNLGAFATPLAINYVTNTCHLGWHWVFWMFAATFIIIGVAALFIRADDPLEPTGT